MPSAPGSQQGVFRQMEALVGPAVPPAPASPEGPPPEAPPLHPHMRAPPLMKTEGYEGKHIPATNDDWLHHTPENISFELSQMAKEPSFVKFPSNLLTVDPCQDDPDFKVWYFKRRDTDYWKKQN